MQSKSFVSLSVLSFLCVFSLRATADSDSGFALTADFVYMQRYHVKDNPIVNNSAVTLCHNGVCNSTVLGTKQLVYNFEPGLQATVSYIQDARSAYEGGGLFIWDMDNTKTEEGPASLFYPFTDASFAGDFYGADKITARYKSQFYTAEINYLKTFSRSRHSFFAFTGIMGIRFANVSEKFDVNSYKNLGYSSYTIKTRNDLIGIQVGIDFKIRPFKTFYWDLLLKGGVDLNRINGKVFLGDDHNTITLRNNTRQKTTAGAFAQAAAGAGVQPYDFLNIHAGYQMLFFGGLALAPDQIDRSSASLTDSYMLTPYNMSDTGYIIVHGIYTGITFSF